jgi:hypothetical protein
VAALGLGACDNGSERAGGSPSFSLSPVTATPVTSPATPPPPLETPPPTVGPAAVDCVNGWVTPAEGTPRYLQPLGIIRRTTGVRGPLVVVDMRYFEGPESPPSDQGYILLVQRWYIRLYAKDDPGFQGRFLVEARRFGRGLSAVAPYDTHSFRSPDWIGFQYDSADTTARSYPGLPGLWEGTPYDFVKGGEGLTIPGLPEQVVGCLDET